MPQCKCDCNLSPCHTFQILSTMAQLLLYDISVPEHPSKAPKLRFNDHSPSLRHISNPDADEFHTHNQTQPYLWNEPTAKVISGGINSFFRHVFLQEITANEANLDLSDLKYLKDTLFSRQYYSEWLAPCRW